MYAFTSQSKVQNLYPHWHLKYQLMVWIELALLCFINDVRNIFGYFFAPLSPLQRLYATFGHFHTPPPLPIKRGCHYFSV